jgi:hypothetical protein
VFLSAVYELGDAVMDMRMTFLESLNDARSRIDGLVMLGVSLLSIVSFILIVINSYFGDVFNIKSNINYSLIFLPLMEYLIYVKLRVFGSGKSLFVQIYNSLLLLIVPLVILFG